MESNIKADTSSKKVAPAPTNQPLVRDPEPTNPTTPTIPTAPEDTFNINDAVDDFYNNVVKGDPMFEAMWNSFDDNEKGLAAMYMHTMNMQNDAMTKKFETALDIAAEQAGPYWREKVNIVKDELKRSLGTLDADLESRESDLMRRRQKLEEDLVYERDFLSAEEQSQLSQIKMSYDVQLDNIREDMSRKGLTSSTIKNQAVEQNETMRGGLIESTQRRTARDLRNLEEGTQFEIGTLQQQTEDFRRGTGEQKTSLVRGVESYLGSSELQNIPGATKFLMGDTTGTMLEDKSQDILNRANALTLSGMGI